MSEVRSITEEYDFSQFYQQNLEIDEQFRSPCENTQRHLANDRERNRTKRLNDAFGLLRKMIPCRPSDKLSKIQTLRLAVLYIDFLRGCLQQDGYLDPRSFAFASVRDKLSKDFSFWRIKREGKRLAKLM